MYTTFTGRIVTITYSGQLYNCTYMSEVNDLLQSYFNVCVAIGITILWNLIALFEMFRKDKIINNLSYGLLNIKMF